jgi:hypothetical protein
VLLLLGKWVLDKISMQESGGCAQKVCIEGEQKVAKSLKGSVS